MAGFPLLDLAIGMSFIYLLLSLICSSLSEGFESLVRFRAKDLEEGVRLLMGEPATPGGFRHIWSQLRKLGKLGDGSLTAALYRHPLIRSLYRAEHTLPTYIPSKSFALALMDMLKTSPELIQNATFGIGGGPAPVQVNIGPQPAPAPSTAGLNPAFAIASSVNNIPVPAMLKSAVESLIIAANHDTVRIRESIEAWFNGTMDRASGWYKRRVQFILFGIAIFVVITANADTIDIFRRLTKTKNLNTIVSSAVQYQTDHDALTSQQLKDLHDATSTLQSLDLGIGWVIPSAAFTSVKDGPKDSSGQPIPTRNAAPVWLADSHLSSLEKLEGYVGWAMELVWMHLLGWTITAAAIALGAPFWFDTLNRFIVVRSTVKPKEKSPEEASKS